MFETFNKRGSRSKIKATRANKDTDRTPANMYSAVEFDAGRPDASRRLTNNYGKTAGKRAEYKPEVGMASSMMRRIFRLPADGLPVPRLRISVLCGMAVVVILGPRVPVDTSHLH